MKNKNDHQNAFPGFEPLGNILPALKKRSRVQSRLIESGIAIQEEESESILFQHTVFCQTGLPYRDPGDNVLAWERTNGRIALSVEAGKAYDPDAKNYKQLGLPYGPKPRLVLAHLNAEALRNASPEIDVGTSLTQFARRIYKNDPNGHELRVLKTQLGRLSVALVRMALVEKTEAIQVQIHVIKKLDLWFPKNEGQRVLWPSMVRLDADYFESLQKHAVPLDERAVASLAHSAMALDIYAWLAQRLHRVPKERSQFIPWTSLHQQFGWHYKRIRAFRAAFLIALDQVHSQYRDAKISHDGRGMVLRNSKPPVAARIQIFR